MVSANKYKAAGGEVSDCSLSGERLEALAVHLLCSAGLELWVRTGLRCGEDLSSGEWAAHHISQSK